MPYSFVINNILVECECSCDCPINQLYKQLEHQLYSIKNDNSRNLTLDLEWIYNRTNAFKKEVRKVLSKVGYDKIKFSKCDNCPCIYHINFKRSPSLELQEASYINSQSQ